MIVVKVRVFCKSDTLFIARWVTAEVPKNVMQIWSICEHLYKKKSDTESSITELALTGHTNRSAISNGSQEVEYNNPRRIFGTRSSRS